ncbi:MAG TPA: flagellar basal body-associated FliL family protein [bacterium]|nr:hypothetical protein [Candidatus Omnitrophota bacterium]HOJ59818.1 flagellar basal body-associated FliL family protein [bacterium]HOL93500.1 flagellar basal body-associated FliL family protein [bacterium]HPP00889.1 flagellar basal body-associated FliL family protein [bacterium]HXK92553.1 flagellar basal body-associated FliL family protein [bacterium]
MSNGLGSQGAPEGKSRLKLPILVAGFVVLIGVIGGVAMMLMGNGVGADEALRPASIREVGYQYEFVEPFTGNLSAPDDQYIYSAKVTLEILPRKNFTEKQATEEMGINTDNPRNKMPRIMQIISDELRSKTRAEINSAAGQLKMRNSIKNALNAILDKAEVVEVYMRLIVT